MDANKKTTKAGTVAERVVWMSRTSDVLGCHMKTDLDSYLTLIRRKIQEKCSTTAELITQIRRNKIGESAHVTPNEFRFTLIKFGIILPQTLVDRIFNVFDSDRSGTMDFDEFAMWIMNSEFKPTVKSKSGGSGKKTGSMETTFSSSTNNNNNNNNNNNFNNNNNKLQQQLTAILTEFPRVFETMKSSISFIEFVSLISRCNLPLSERDARAVFLLLDPYDHGCVEAQWIREFASMPYPVFLQHHTQRISKLSRNHTGNGGGGGGKGKGGGPNAANSNNNNRNRSLSPSHNKSGSLGGTSNPEIPDSGLHLKYKSLKEIISKVIGYKTKQLENAFQHIIVGQGTKISFEEFRRGLLNAGK
jgi:hypothetical protein